MSKHIGSVDTIIAFNELLQHTHCGNITFKMQFTLRKLISYLLANLLEGGKQVCHTCNLSYLQKCIFTKWATESFCEFSLLIGGTGVIKIYIKEQQQYKPAI